MRRPAFIARHARKPEGLLGRLLARITSYETRAHNLATLQALDLQPTDHVLELGCGLGRAVAKVAQIVTEGVVTGVDHSAVVVEAASHRCRALIKLNRARLHVADSARLPFPDDSFDKAYAVHTLYFWADPCEHLREVRRVLRSGGLLVLGVRKKREDGRRDSFPGSIYTFYDTREIAQMLRESGFLAVKVQEGGTLFTVVVASLVGEQPG